MGLGALSRNIDPVTFENKLSDLDLAFGSYGYSSSWNNNVEILDVPANVVSAGNTYTVKILKYTNRLPSNAFTYYSLAWTWVKNAVNQPN